MTFFDQLREIDFSLFNAIYDLGRQYLWIEWVFYFFARYGVIFFFLSFIYLIIRKKIPAFLCTLMAMGLAGVVDFLVFIFWQRPTPIVTYPQLIAPDIAGISETFGSFPSSHTYIVFAIATSVILYGHKKLGSFLVLLALLVAIGRVGTGLHYPSDILGGIILGILSGYIVYSICCKWEKRKERVYINNP